MKLGVCFLLIILFVGCRNNSNPVFTHKFKNLNKKEATLETKKNAKAYVFIFLVPDCPFAQFYAMGINQVYSNYFNQGFQFYGIVPGKLYSQQEIKTFKNNFNFLPEILIDENYFLSRNYKVDVVPTALVIDNNGKQIYFGKIDDQAIQPGQKKYNPTQFYLLDALKSIVHKTPIANKKTIPVGCYIE